jgi:hypothetical protein
MLRQSGAAAFLEMHAYHYAQILRPQPKQKHSQGTQHMWMQQHNALPKANVCAHEQS